MQQFNHSPPIYQQPPMSEPFWAQEALHYQTYPQEKGVTLVHQYYFININTEQFQPQEIFQKPILYKPLVKHQPVMLEAVHRCFEI